MEQPELAQPEEWQLASRGARLAAAIVDALISLLVMVPLLLIVGEHALAENRELSSAQRTLFVAVSLCIFLGCHGYLLKTYGQTIGKRLMKIQIVSLEGNILPLKPLIVRRYLPFWLIGLIPSLSMVSIINSLFIFRKDKRCLHDLLAGTVVRKVSCL